MPRGRRLRSRKPCNVIGVAGFATHRLRAASGRGTGDLTGPEQAPNRRLSGRNRQRTGGRNRGRETGRGRVARRRGRIPDPNPARVALVSGRMRAPRDLRRLAARRPALLIRYAAARTALLMAPRPPRARRDRPGVRKTLRATLSVRQRRKVVADRRLKRDEKIHVAAVRIKIRATRRRTEHLQLGDAMTAANLGDSEHGSVRLQVASFPQSTDPGALQQIVPGPVMDLTSPLGKHDGRSPGRVRP